MAHEPRPRRPRTESGTSLLELVAALTLIALVATIGISAFHVALDRASLNRAAREIRLSILRARLESGILLGRARFFLDVDRSSYGISRSLDGAETPITRARRLPTSVRVDPNQSTRIIDGRIAIEFPLRGLVATPATVALLSEKHARRWVVVSAAGKVEIR